jgi:hypothetical protein
MFLAVPPVLPDSHQAACLVLSPAVAQHDYELPAEWNRSLYITAVSYMMLCLFMHCGILNSFLGCCLKLCQAGTALWFPWAACVCRCLCFAATFCKAPVSGCQLTSLCARFAVYSY